MGNKKGVAVFESYLGNPVEKAWGWVGCWIGEGERSNQ